MNKKLPLTAVSRNGEKCGKFTFFFRKKYYLSGKLSGYEVRHFLKPRNVACYFTQIRLDIDIDENLTLGKNKILNQILRENMV